MWVPNTSQVQYWAHAGGCRCTMVSGGESPGERRRVVKKRKWAKGRLRTKLTCFPGVCTGHTEELRHWGGSADIRKIINVLRFHHHRRVLTHYCKGSALSDSHFSSAMGSFGFWACRITDWFLSGQILFSYTQTLLVMKTRFPLTLSFTFRYPVAVWNEQVSSLSHIFHTDAKPPCFLCLALKGSLENTVARSENLFSIQRVNWLFQKNGAPEAAFLSRVHVKAF